MEFDHYRWFFVFFFVLFCDPISFFKLCLLMNTYSNLLLRDGGNEILFEQILSVVKMQIESEFIEVLFFFFFFCLI